MWKSTGNLEPGRSLAISGFALYPINPAVTWTKPAILIIFEKFISSFRKTSVFMKFEIGWVIPRFFG
jgi:hypothetical protein